MAHRYHSEFILARREFQNWSAFVFSGKIQSKFDGKISRRFIFRLTAPRTSFPASAPSNTTTDGENLKNVNFGGHIGSPRRRTLGPNFADRGRATIARIATIARLHYVSEGVPVLMI